MILGLRKIRRNHGLAEGEVGEVGSTTPKPNSYTLPESYAQNKRVTFPNGSTIEFSAENKKTLRGIDLIRGTAYRKALYFTNGDSFGKVRGMINLMRSKVKTKFARKKKKA